MKIKAVCEKTGLTDRTIRYYIEEGLITPSFTENYLGRKSFVFSSDDISKLCDIAILRNYGFSIAEINKLISTPENSPEIIKAVKERISNELTTNEKKLSVLSSLNENTIYTLSGIAIELSRHEMISSAMENIEKNIWRRIASVVKSGILFLIVWLPIFMTVGIISSLLVKYEHPIANRHYLLAALVLVIPSILSIISAKIKIFGNKIFKAILLSICLICIPLSIFVSFSTVRECEHSWTTITVESEVSCTQEGRIVKQCSECQDVRLEIVKKLPHTVTTDKQIEATCYNEGLSEGEHCSVCKTVLTKQEPIPVKKHTYVKKQIYPTCNKNGYVLFTCNCGDSYIGSILTATEKHNFKKNAELGYICSTCSLEVCEYGFVTGTSWGDESTMRYYITGIIDGINEVERTLVIYGSGDMPNPTYQTHHPWRKSNYVEEITSIVICEGVTSIADGAFSGAISDDDFFGNPFHSVQRFIIKGNSLTVPPDCPDINGIECDITYCSLNQ